MEEETNATSEKKTSQDETTGKVSVIYIYYEYRNKLCVIVFYDDFRRM